MFCVGVALHPTLSPAPGTLVLSYAPGSLSADAAARRAADPAKWWPQLVAVPLPILP
jgi:hypothetical protein